MIDLFAVILTEKEHKLLRTILWLVQHGVTPTTQEADENFLSLIYAVENPHITPKRSQLNRK